MVKLDRSWWKRIVVVMGLLLAAPPAMAQVPPEPTSWGLYFKEIRKDERIYVFNIPAEAVRFEASGEMGRALTRPGSGPNGETVVGDSERALQLFYFKHNLSEAVPDPIVPKQIVEWRDGKTRISTDLAYLEVSNRVMVRYTHEFPGLNSPQLAGTAGAGDSRGSFRMRRLKLKLEGWLWLPPGVAPAVVTQPKITYEVQLNWPDANTAGNPGAFLEDAMIGVDPRGTGRFRVLFGQFKQSGRQQLTSSGNQQFADRSLVSDEYSKGRQTGVAVQGVLRNNTIEYRLGMHNGNGKTQVTNDNTSFQVNGRLMWQPNGNQVLAQRAWVSGALYSEADFESTTAPLYAVALNYEHNDFHRTTTGNDLRSDVGSFDAIFKYKGWFATGEFYLRKRVPETGINFRSNGGFAQLSKMLNQFRTWEVAARFGRRDVNNKIDNDNINELRVGLSYYYRRHTLKFQIDAGQIQTGLGTVAATATDTWLGTRKDKEVRAQTQFIF